MMQTVAKSVTIGDFLSHTYGTGEGNETQTGDSFNILNTTVLYDVNKVVDIVDSISTRYDKGQLLIPATETIGITVQYISPDNEVLQTRVMDGEMLDAAFPLGEQNVSIDFITDLRGEK